LIFEIHFSISSRLFIIEDGNSKVGVNTQSANKIVYEALDNNMIKELNNILEIKPEVKFGSNTRFDFLLVNKKNKVFVEVKNVTLSRKKNLAEFPDTVTSRGLKHIDELLKAFKKGFQIYILYLIQRDDCDSFAIAKDIDKNYCDALLKAVKNDLNVLCYDCKFSLKGIKLNNRIKFIK